MDRRKCNGGGLKMGINSDNIRAKIQRAYYKDKRVADDDALLLAIIWEMSGWERNAPLLTNLRKMPSPETVRRTRAKLVADGVIKPSMSAIDRRYASWKRVRKALGYEEI